MTPRLLVVVVGFKSPFTLLGLCGREEISPAWEYIALIRCYKTKPAFGYRRLDVILIKRCGAVLRPKTHNLPKVIWIVSSAKEAQAVMIGFGIPTDTI